MKDIQYSKIYTTGCGAPLKIRSGHFASNHAHLNYYIDVTTLKTRASEAHEIANALTAMYLYGTVIDTIVCMEGTDVIGAFLSEELTKSGFLSTNAHKTIYVVHPEFNMNSQLIFRDNLVSKIAGKNVMILMASVTTGKTLNKVLECIQYYQGKLAGISAIFSALEEYDGMRISAVFGKSDLPEYASWDYRVCPLCKAGEKLDALVNAYGYASLG
ncbi:orotate phosphoribosyltransferase [Fusobacterium naviforme]|uniref:Orotate phosphoribosyltransferase n=1 Tax=Moryella indoligenes TaxID=371674 RepID=A0AAE4AK87_9FIRM|nr:phosphoribosyltransferase [Moryella indoligenes]KAB0577184.1 orotate phosphoribosyltransferase [Fusobacterium naviforme]MDQ0152633.1 orotate phosphoribosyltransferase [Moryella indoligenes]PSL10142.1 orotate phosphoribosyltransferase [Fusobacterium naviforme]STO27551.1 Uncharacterised protein [Fusobacterium naviforme]